MLDRLTQRAKHALLASTTTTPKSGFDNNITAKKLVDSIANSGGVGTFLLKNNPNLKIKPRTKVEINELVERAFYYSAFLKHLYVGTEHLLVALLELINSPDHKLVKKQLAKMATFPNANILTNEFDMRTPIVEAFGINLNKKVSQQNYSKPVHRDAVNTLMRALLKKDNSNALIVGDYGVGKESLVELLAYKIDSFDIPIALAGFQIIEFDVMAFISSISTKEGIDGGLTALLEDLDKVGDTILYIKNFQNVFIGTPSGLAIPLAFSLLRTYLSESGISIIGAISSDFYDKISSETSSLLDTLEIVELDDPEEELTKEILHSKVSEYERFHGVKVGDPVLDFIFKKADELDVSAFPQKAIDLLDYSCAVLLLNRDRVSPKYKQLVDEKINLHKKLDDLLSAGDFSNAIEIKKTLDRTEIKLSKMRRQFGKSAPLVLTEVEVEEALEDFGIDSVDDKKVDLKSLSELATKLKAKIVGQDQAVEVVSKALVRSKLGLRPRKRPLGNFLFLGPTGVGKTEMAKVLSSEAFGDKNLIRLDMSDFSEKHNVARLVGAPPGYVGYGEGGELTSKINEFPDSVVLFDEIEKAHPDVLNILLQIMDEGELKDSKGTAFDFSRAVVVLTSNLGTDIILKQDIGFVEGEKSDESVEGRLKGNLKKIMKPELLNRFDEIVVFRKLTKTDQKKVLNLLLKEIDETLKKQDIKLKVRADAKKYLLEKGYSSEYGARGLRRVVERELLDKVAEYLLENPQRPLSLTATDGDDVLIIE